MADILEKDIKFLNGVGPKRAELLNRELSLYTFEDLLYYFPYKHIDRTKFHAIREITPDMPYIQFSGEITAVEMAGGGNKKRLIAYITDGTGVMELLWFRGLKWIGERVKPGKKFVVYGKPSSFGGKTNLVHPELEEPGKQDPLIRSTMQSFYSTTEKLRNSFVTSRVMHKLINTLLQNVYGKLPETLPGYLVRECNLMPLNDALLNIHFPQSQEKLKRATFRLKFEELFYVQLNILRQKANRNATVEGFIFSKVGDLMKNFYSEHLPFELTGAQKRVLREIRHDMGSGRQMNRLLQGDVGSGKTLVAIMSMLIALDNGFQACLMAPTEILAGQHYSTLKKILGEMPVKIDLLTGSTRNAHRKKIHEKLISGELQILIGTHALIEDTVKYRELGLVVIDEQHRFGVAQRAKMWLKNVKPPHVLVMTATPIPRTLAMTVYGDLEVSVIDELPPGRKPVKTAHYFDTKRERMFGFLREQIKKGQQVYIVYPLIKESEKMDYKDLEDGYESIVRAFPPPEYVVTIVHGQMKPEEKESGMRQFVTGRAHIMVATTVIEVGVDVPNASVMVIESAERFGLSQLHQLRGRVGRGAEQSYCILMSSYKLSKEAIQRLKTLTGTNDGFEIAEADLKLRGPGDIEGTLQSGFPFDLKISHIGKDAKILEYARSLVMRILDEDPRLENPDNGILVRRLKHLKRKELDWSKIS